jgi:hypothetical protein
MAAWTVAETFGDLLFRGLSSRQSAPSRSQPYIRCLTVFSEASNTRAISAMQ